MGLGASLIGVHESIPIMPLAPMLMFAILFGLSMDYEVFLLSRVREQFREHGDAHRAVVEGVGATGRVITSAALIMIAVFGSFVLGGDPTTKVFGIGLGVAVLLDVTLIRMVLVPAVMSVLDARAWWLPAWLDRFLPHIDLDATVDKEALPRARRPRRHRSRSRHRGAPGMSATCGTDRSSVRLHVRTIRRSQGSPFLTQGSPRPPRWTGSRRGHHSVRRVGELGSGSARQASQPLAPWCIPGSDRKKSPMVCAHVETCCPRVGVAG